MKRLVLVLLVGLIGYLLTSPSVSAYLRGVYDKSSGRISFNLAGAKWYLIPHGSGGACDKDGNIFWIWSPTQRKYIGGRLPISSFLQSDLQKLQNDEDRKYAYASSFGGAWVYTAMGPCEVSNGFANEYDASLEEFSKFKLAEGWNFLTIAPSFVDKSFNDLKGSCNVVKVADWNSDEQKWNVAANVENALNSVFRSDDTSGEDIGGVIAVKASEECNLGLVNSPAAQPPAIPE